MPSEKEPLTGKALLQKIKEVSNLSRREVAKRCGYYNTSSSGQIKINLTDFYDAVLAAKGIALEPEGTKDGRGREATYRVSVHKNGQLVIGSNYTKEMGLKPGDQFEIKLGYKHIHLIYLGEASQTEESELDEETAEVA